MIRIRAVLAVIATVAASALAGAAAATTWDMPSPYPDDDFRSRSAQAFADQVRSATQGELAIVVFANGSLLKDGQIDAALRANQVPLGVYELATLAGGAPVFAFSSLPFLADTYTDSLRLWNAARPVVQRRAAEAGVMVLYALPSPPSALFSKQQVSSVADLQGGTLYARDEWLRRLAGEIGAVAADSRGANLPEALAKGRNALFAPPELAVQDSAWRYVGNAYDVQASFPLAIVAVNQQAFYALSEPAQRALLNAAVEAQNDAWSRSVDQRNAKVEVLGQNNLTVQTPPAALQDGLVKAGDAIAREWQNAAGSDGRAILAAYGGKGAEANYEPVPVVTLTPPGEKNLLATSDPGYRQRCAGISRALSLDDISVTPASARAGEPINHSFTYTYCAAQGDAALVGRLATTIAYQGRTVVTDEVDHQRLVPGQWQVDTRIVIPAGASPGTYDLTTRFAGSGASFERSTSFRVE